MPRKPGPAVTVWSGPDRPTSKRASHTPAVHEPQQRSFCGHREALGRTPPGAYQTHPGYGPAVLVATPHHPAEPDLQDHEGSQFSLGMEGTFSAQSLQNDQFSHTGTRRARDGNVQQCAATTRLQMSPQARRLSRRRPSLRTLTGRHAASSYRGDQYSAGGPLTTNVDHN